MGADANNRPGETAVIFNSSKWCFHTWYSSWSLWERRSAYWSPDNACSLVSRDPLIRSLAVLASVRSFGIRSSSSSVSHQASIRCSNSVPGFINSDTIPRNDPAVFGQINADDSVMILESINSPLDPPAENRPNRFWMISDVDKVDPDIGLASSREVLSVVHEETVGVDGGTGMKGGLARII